MRSSFFETIKIVDGIVQNIGYHQKRYESVLNNFGVVDFKELSTFIDAPKKGIYRCRLTYHFQNILQVEYFKYKKRKITSLKLIYDDTIEYSLKSRNRDKLNKLFDKKEHCDDILVVKKGFITDTSIANIALYKSGRWITPRSTLLDGTTRQRLLDEQKIFLGDIRVEDLDEFSEVALLNAMIDFDIIPLNKGEFFVR